MQRTKDTADLADKIQKDIQSLINKLDNNEISPLLDSYPTNIADFGTTSVITDMFDANRVLGFSTGYEELDTAIGGLRTQTLTVLAGATGMGKSLLAINILLNLASKGVKVCYFDLENGTEQSLERLLRIKNKLPADYFKDTENKDNAAILLNALGGIKYYSHETLYSLDLQKQGIRLIVSLIKSAVKDGVSVFLIDPLQALETSLSSSDSYNEQGQIIKVFKEVAQTYKCSIIICHHMRKAVSGGSQWVSEIEEAEKPKYRMPTIDDLKGSGKIADFATDVWGILRMIDNPNKDRREKMMIRILKNRSGGRGDLYLKLDETTLSINQYERPGDEYKGRDAIDILGDRLV